MFGLVDCNNFYASCERVFDPKLKNKPVLVLSNNDGCVIARSNEVKAIGIKMGEPLFKIQHLIRQHQIQVFSSNYTLYGDMSSRVMQVLSQFTPDLEIYSIDEAFLGLDGFGRYDLNEYVATIRSTVKQWVGIPVCVGVAQTKTLAKSANRYAKKAAGSNGTFIINSEDQRYQVLTVTPVDDVWGIGRQYAAKLQHEGIANAWQLSNKSTVWANKNLGGVVGVRLIHELNGTSCIGLEQQPEPKQSIACTRSFSQAVISLGDLSEAVSAYTIRAAEKLRKQQSVTRTITVFIQNNRYNEKEEQYIASRAVSLPVASEDTTELIHYALASLRSIFKEGITYKKAGVILSHLSPANQVQIGLFDQKDRSKSKALMQTMDKLNARFGNGTVSIASAGTKQEWSMNRSRLSKRFTTRWEDLLEVK